MSYIENLLVISHNFVALVKLRHQFNPEGIVGCIIKTNRQLLKITLVSPGLILLKFYTLAHRNGYMLHDLIIGLSCFCLFKLEKIF